MKNIELLLATFGLLGGGGGMAAYEWSRIKAKRPLFKGRQVVVLYWVAYLSLLVLGLTTGIAVVVRG